jgi:SAM-dependent methyltransferase
VQAKEITEANRRAWNAVASVHHRTQGEALMSQFAVRGASCLDSVEWEHLQRIGIEGKRVGQLCCNNGREIVSLMNRGARSAVGFDISEAVLEEAQKLATLAGVTCTFVRSDVYEISDEFSRAFDLVYVSVGALGWMPDLARFFQVAARLLALAGSLFIYEMHPILDMYDPRSETPIIPTDSYFRTEPFVETVGLDYVGGSDHEGPPQYWFHHSMASIVNGVVGAGMQIDSLHELAHDVSGLYGAIAESPHKPPMSYILTARKL